MTHALEGRVHLGQFPVGPSTGEGLINNDGILWLHSSNNSTNASSCQLACVQQYVIAVSRLGSGSAVHATDVVFLANKGWQMHVSNITAMAYVGDICSHCALACRNCYNVQVLGN